MEMTVEPDQIDVMWDWVVRKCPSGRWNVGPHVFRTEKDNQQIQNTKYGLARGGRNLKIDHFQGIK